MTIEQQIENVEQLCGFKLFDYQKKHIELILKAQQEGKTLYVTFPKTVGRRMMHQFLEKWEDTFIKQRVDGYETTNSQTM